MSIKYKVTDDAFNQKNYPDLVGQVLDNPPAYAKVELIKDLPPMDDIYKSQSNWFGYEEVATDKLEDFVIKCLRVGYDKPEIIEGLEKYFRQDEEVAQSIFTRAVVKMKNIKLPKDTKEVKHRKASENSWYKKAKKEKEDKTPLTTEERQEVKNKFGSDLECSFAKDKDGYYCYTHRARSDSYSTISKIPKSKVEFIGSTG